MFHSHLIHNSLSSSWPFAPSKLCSFIFLLSSQPSISTNGQSLFPDDDLSLSPSPSHSRHLYRRPTRHTFIFFLPHQPSTSVEPTSVAGRHRPPSCRFSLSLTLAGHATETPTRWGGADRICFSFFFHLII